MQKTLKNHDNELVIVKGQLNKVEHKKPKPIQ
jgi:hypothetical protein